MHMRPKLDWRGRWIAHSRSPGLRRLWASRARSSAALAPYLPNMDRDRQPASRIKSPSVPPAVSQLWAKVWRNLWGLMAQASGSTAIANNLVDPVGGEWPNQPQPQGGMLSVAMFGAHPEVPVERHRGALAEGAGTGSPPLAHHHGAVRVEVNVADVQPREFRPSHPSVE